MSAAEICSIILNKILQRSENGCEALQKVTQLSRGLEEGGVQSLKAAVEGESDEVSKTQARVILGECFVMKGEPAQAREHLGPWRKTPSDCEINMTICWTMKFAEPICFWI